MYSSILRLTASRKDQKPISVEPHLMLFSPIADFEKFLANSIQLRFDDGTFGLKFFFSIRKMKENEAEIMMQIPNIV